jgi:glycosyltransferase involved in cell wall biosynthesis
VAALSHARQRREQCKELLVQSPCVLVPALDAADTVGDVVKDLRAVLDATVIVIDDGSTDATGERARARGAVVVRHDQNAGKGQAIRSGLREAAKRGFDVVLTVDADGQHPATSARRVLGATSDPRALVLGVRDLVRDGAPASNRFGNGVSNVFLSAFARKRLRDTQCGLRRYPVAETLALGARARGYAFEAEVVLRAIAAGLPIVEVPVDVIYPTERLRRTHFRGVLDPLRIVATVARTVLELRLGGQ